MSTPTPSDPEHPFHRAIGAVPSWLVQPAVARPREPRYYGFLEKYAKLLLWFGLIEFIVISLGILAALLFPRETAHGLATVVGILSRHSSGSVAEVADLDSPMSFLVRLVFGLGLVGVVFFSLLLPTILVVAYVLLSVDAARNLRALEQREH